MNTRLLEFIQYKTSGKQAEFAELLGWSPQYLNKLIREGSIGLKPVTALLERFPELNARWILLGEGAMVTSGVNVIKNHLFRLMQLEKYMPVMTPEELRQLAEWDLNFKPGTVARWEILLNDRNEQIANRFKEAYKKQDELCKMNKA